MTFNLLRDAWIPVRAPGSALRWIAPSEIGELGDALYEPEWGRPEFRIATYELLIGMFAVALADRLEESADWIGLLDAPLSRAELTARFEALLPYFDLDGPEKRFLQDLDPLEGEARPVDSLLIDAPGENTLKNGADIFAKRGRFPVFSRKAAAIALYAMQAFAPSGGAGHRTSLRGGGPLTTLVVPERPTLWRRIVANLPFMRDPDLSPPQDLTLVFPWAKPTRLSTKDTKTQFGLHAHDLQCYFGMPRRIRLVFEANAQRAPCALTGEVDGIIVTGFVTEPWGVSYGPAQHPLSPYYRSKPGEPPLPIHAQSGRIGYRDWTGYLFQSPAPDAASLCAQQVIWFESVFRQKDARLEAAGFVTDNMKCLDWAEGAEPLFLLENEHARARLADLAQRQLVPAAASVLSALRGALRDALNADDVQKTALANAAERFWTDTHDAFFEVVAAAQERLKNVPAEAGADDVQKLDLADLSRTWLAVMQRAALRIFNKTAPLERLADLDQGAVERIVGAAKFLRFTLLGLSKAGASLFNTLGLPSPERKADKAFSSQVGFEGASA